MFSLSNIEEYPEINYKKTKKEKNISEKEFLFRKLRLHLISGLSKESLTEFIQKGKVFVEFVISDKAKTKIVKTNLKSKLIITELNGVFVDFEVLKPAIKNKRPVNVSFVLLIKFNRKKPIYKKRPRRYY